MFFLAVLGENLFLDILSLLWSSVFLNLWAFLVLPSFQLLFLCDISVTVMSLILISQVILWLNQAYVHN